MRVGKGVALAGAAALGVCVGVLPAVASSETSPIEAENGPGYYEHSWKPSSLAVGEGTTVTISNKTEVPHGVEWKEGPETPTCEKVPVGAGNFGTKWSGTCTFKKPGTYLFWCTYHGKSMSATVTVQPASTTTGSTTGTTPGGTTGTTPGGGGGGGTNGFPTVSPLASPPGSPVANAAITAVKLRSQQHGRTVRGSLDVSSAGAGGRLEVDLLAKRASLASARSSSLRVGRLVRSAVGPGTVSFQVPLSASGRRVLARAGRLVLLVEITLTPHSGKAAVIKRTVTLRA
jgi:plastocyanin